VESNAIFFCYAFMRASVFDTHRQLERIRPVVMIDELRIEIGSTAMQ